MNRRTIRLATGISLVCGSSFVTAADSFQVVVQGNNLSWGESTAGYMQVQDAESYETLCEFRVSPSLNDSSADTLCTLESGVYNVINHTLGQRIDGVLVGDVDGAYTAPEPLVVDGDVVTNERNVSFNAGDVYDPIVDTEAGQTVPVAANLTAVVYSPSSAEIFWDRAEQSGLEYDVYIRENLVGTTDGTSFFLGELSPRNTWAITVIARDPQGFTSEPAAVSPVTGDDGSAEPPRFMQFTPSALRAQVYSANTIELFWQRQGFLQMFEVRDGSGEVVSVTDGTSFFATGLPPADVYNYSVYAVGVEGNYSEPAFISVRTSGPAITEDNAVAMLEAAVRIANRKQFENVEALMETAASAVLDTTVFVSETDAVSNADFALEFDNSGENIFEPFGLQYGCISGGKAQDRALASGPVIDVVLVNFSECSIADGIFSGRYYYDDAVDDGDGLLAKSVEFEDIEITPADSEVRFVYDGSVYQRDGDYANKSKFYAKNADSYFESDIESGVVGLQIINYSSIVNTFVPDPTFDSFADGSTQESNRSASAVIDFDVSFQSRASADEQFPFGLYRADIDLGYDANVDAADPVDLWNSGQITVTAVSDGSQLIAKPIDTDGDTTFESMSIEVGDTVIVVPVNSSNLVSCISPELEACSSSTED